MKYKIGELEVEAVKWNGDNHEEIITLLGDKMRDIGVFNSLGSKDLTTRDRYITKGSYFFTLNDNLNILLEQDFNKIAIKVKEPKFKVGDEVYYNHSSNGEVISFRILKIKSVLENSEYYYRAVGEGYKFKESDLLTLEEAIEKLKEL